MNPQDLLKMKQAQKVTAPVSLTQHEMPAAANSQAAADLTREVATAKNAEPEAGAMAVSAPAELVIETKLAGGADENGVPIGADDKMALAIQDAHLEPESAQALLAAFAPAMLEAKKLANMAKPIVVTSASQLTQMKLARQIRLAIRVVRVDADKTRKRLKEDSIRRGKAIDGVFHVLEYLVTPIEERLQECEDFAEREEAKAQAKVKADREEMLKPYGIDTSFYTLDAMPEENFTRLLEDTRRAHQSKVDERIRLEKERQERERVGALEDVGRQRRIKLDAVRVSPTAHIMTISLLLLGELPSGDFDLVLAEHTRLFKEEVERETKARLEQERKARDERESLQREKDAADKKAREAKAAQDKAEKELADRKKRDAEAAKKKAEDEAKAKRAPDKAKLQGYAEELWKVPVPTMKTEGGVEAADHCRRLVDQLKKEIERIAAQL